MRRISIILTFILTLCASTVTAGTFVSGSTGADGEFSPVSDTVLQIPPSGIFNFTTVNIPAGVTVTFSKNVSNTPIYILATGNVAIAGAIDVSGKAAPSKAPGVGGPGGYDGGWGGSTDILSSSGAGGNGLGPGGGGGGPNSNYYIGGGGGFGTAGASTNPNYGVGGPIYGNAMLVPMIGGSGGGGSATGSGWPPYGGGGGGGALLIASSGSIDISGYITAAGGNTSYGSGAGSGGAIKLIANQISGAAYYIIAIGGVGYYNANTGGDGRIRIETFNNAQFSGTSRPAYSSGLPGSVFVANTPSLRITSIAGVNVSSNPTGSYFTPDIALPSTSANPVTVTLSASNIPLSATINVSAIPQCGGAANAAATLVGNDIASTGTANVYISPACVNVIMAYTTYTLQSAMYYDGEKINKVRVASSIGSKSETVYITESGKEIKAEKLILAGLLK